MNELVVLKCHLRKRPRLNRALAMIAKNEYRGAICGFGRFANSGLIEGGNDSDRPFLQAAMIGFQRHFLRRVRT